MSNLLDLVKSGQMKDGLPPMHPGDTVRVHARIVEGNKERIQVFEGVIISLRRGQNASSITVRRISHASIGVERTFLLHSPRIDRFEVVRRGRVRRAKLYYLRSRQGKSARIKELRPSRQAAEARAAAAAAATTAAEPTPIETVATPVTAATPETPRAEPTEITAPAASAETDVATGVTDTEAAGATTEPVGLDTPAEAQE